MSLPRLFFYALLCPCVFACWVAVLIKHRLDLCICVHKPLQVVVHGRNALCICEEGKPQTP